MKNENVVKTTSRETDMTVGKPLPLIFKFFLPLFIGNVFQQVYNMVDSVIVGRYVSAEALGAVGLTGTIMFLLLGLASGLTQGFAVLCGQRFGAGDIRGLKRSVANAVILSVVSALVITALGAIFMNPMLRIMNTPEDIYQDAYHYIIIIDYGIICTVFYDMFSAFLRSVGNSKVPLYFLILCAGLNIVLDLLFIVVFHMGTGGAALATVVSQAISALLCGIYLFVKFPILIPEKSDWKIHREESKKQIAVGVPMALQFGVTASGTMVMQAAINVFGSVAISAFTAGCKVVQILTQGFPAMGQTMAAYCAQNYGKKEAARIKEGVRVGTWLSNAYAVIAMVLCVLLLKPALYLFYSSGTDISAYLPWARTYVYLSMIFFIPLGFIFVYRNVMQGCGYGFLPLMGGVIEFVARVITAIIAIHVHSYALAAFCDPAAWIATGIFTLVAYRFILKKIYREFERE